MKHHHFFAHLRLSTVKCNRKNSVKWHDLTYDWSQDAELKEDLPAYKCIDSPTVITLASRVADSLNASLARGATSCNASAETENQNGEKVTLVGLVNMTQDEYVGWPRMGPRPKPRPGRPERPAGFTREWYEQMRNEHE